MTYHVGLHSLPIGRSSLVDVTANEVRANKRDGPDGRVITDEVHSCDREEQGGNLSCSTIAAVIAMAMQDQIQYTNCSQVGEL